ncbi:MAG: BREX-6 system BrxE protein, partial [Polyangiaceae bacterium]
TVAWAGETGGEPKRLGWWRTDLVDPQGGGDLFMRLVPRTAPWAGLALVRAAARRVDEVAREKVARGDLLWTPFHFGFETDEQLDDRLAYHRSHEHHPSEALGARYLVGQPWSPASFRALLSSLAAPTVTITPSGRKVSARAASAGDAAPLLFAALAHGADGAEPALPATYPLPYIEPEP